MKHTSAAARRSQAEALLAAVLGAQTIEVEVTEEPDSGSDDDGEVSKGS